MSKYFPTVTDIVLVSKEFYDMIHINKYISTYPKFTKCSLHMTYVKDLASPA